MSTVVAKIGSSSLTDERGVIDLGAVVKLCQEVIALLPAATGSWWCRAAPCRRGWPPSVSPPARPPAHAPGAVGAGGRLMQVYNDILGHYGAVGAQVLLDSKSFVDRRRYLHARQTLTRLLELGCVPVVNENDAVAPDELRFGDNDRIAALVSHLVAADVLVLLTDTPGLFTADPRVDAAATLIEEVAADDPVLVDAGGTGSMRCGPRPASTPCPPLPRAEPVPPASTSTGSSAATSSMSVGGGVDARVGGEQARRVGEQDEHVGGDEVGDEGGDAVVVAEADLVVGDGVVLVDDRHAAELEQADERLAGVEVLAAVDEVVRVEQHLRADHAVVARAMSL